MNEKIKQLAEQANVLDVTWPELGLTPWIKNRNQVEKFAELIIKECAEIARVYSEEGVEFNGGDAIKEHFGVKE